MTARVPRGTARWRVCVFFVSIRMHSWFFSSMRWCDTPIHVIDFEGNLTSGVLEFGIVTLLGGAVQAARTRLCGAIGRIRTSDTAIHQIEGGMVAGSPPFRDDFDAFARLRETGPLAAHFASAENTLLKATWPYPRTSPDFARPGGTVLDWGPWIDTGRLYGQVFPELPSTRLEDLVTALGLQPRLDQLASAHCPPLRRMYHAALYDALAAALLLLSLGERPEFAGMTLPWLLQLSTLNPEKRAALRQQDWTGASAPE